MSKESPHAFKSTEEYMDYIAYLKLDKGVKHENY